MLSVVLLSGVAAPVEASDDEEDFVVIKARKVITVSGKEIRNGVIVIVNGKIRSVGRGLEYPLNAKVIDARERVVMPGLISAHSRFNLPRFNRNGVHGQLSVADEYFPREGQYDELLDAGYTTLALTPPGSGIPGRAIVVRTAGETDARILLSPAHLKVSWEKKVFSDALKKAAAEIEKVEKARKEFEEKQKKGDKKPMKKKGDQKKKKPAKKPTTQPTTTTAPTTQPVFKPPKISEPHRVLVDLIQKKEGLFALIELRRASDALHMLELLGRYEIAHKFLLRNRTQTDFYRVAERLGEREAKIVMWPYVNRIPYSTERIHVVRQFDDAGCEVSLIPLRDTVTEHQRMRARLAELVRVGWSREAALKSVTLHPARLLGLEERLGSIEKGRDADLIFLDGDPLDPLSRVREVMIAGRIVHEVETEDE